MNALEFRARGDLRNALAEILSQEVLQIAFAIVTSTDMGSDVPINSDAIVSVRMLSQRSGRDGFPMLVQELTLPLENAPKQALETFGTEHTIEDFDNPEPDK